MNLGRRGWSRLAGSVGVLGLLVAGCSNEIGGQAEPAPIPPLTATESITQSMVNFGEAGTVHYKGTLTSASDEKIGFDLTVSAAGEVLGAITVDEAPAAVLMLDKSMYLKAPAAFWAALRGVGDGADKGTAIADRWVKLPSVLLGVEFAEMFTPDAISTNLTKAPTSGGDTALAERPTIIDSGREVIKIPLENGAVYLEDKQPYGVVKLEMSRLGGSDNTRVKNLVAQVSDTSADSATFYQNLATQAGQLNTAVDALTTVQQGPHRFDACGPDSCSLVVEFTNTAKVPVRVQIKANWTGDDAPLGSCEIEVGPVAPGTPGTGTCTLATPEWAAFWQRAHSVAGTHPYGATWAPLVLADPPDLAAVTGKAAAKPADPKDRKTAGTHYVYSISAAGTVWKYGVVASRYWADHAGGQLRTCLATNTAVCGFALVTATDNVASAYALEKQLIDAHRTKNGGGCPAGQWVSCTR